ncbi:MAG TPA: hypothetical protein VFK06_18185 [Candidatus Angelobacter sp.]|nr:hypothetical protein [Candidatus Angelobacter sp.]
MAALKRICLAVWLLSLSLQVVAQQPAQADGVTPPAAAIDAREIVRRSVETDHRNWEKARNYTCQHRVVEKELDKSGKPKSTKTQTFDVTFYYDEEYSRLVQKDDKPLTPEEQKKVDNQLNKFLEKHRNESEDSRKKRLAKLEKERQEERAFLRDVVNAYDFKLAGEEQVDGFDAWVIEATPRKGFHPTQPHADILSKVKGRLWIEKKEYNWVKAEAEVVDTISFGLFLARVHPGTKLSFVQMHVNDEVWLVRKFSMNASARLALFKNAAFEQEDTFSSYRKFSSTVRILPGAQEVSPEPATPAAPK